MTILLCVRCKCALLHFLLYLLLLLELLVDVPPRMVLMEPLEQILNILISPTLLVNFRLECALLLFFHLLEDPCNLHVMILIALH